MEILYSHVAGIDVHKKTAVVCCRIHPPTGKPHKETRTFSTMTTDLLALSAWLTGLEITHVVMESTGEFWKPLYNLLEGSFTVLVANAQHVKQVPGRKTDVKDAEWLAELLAHGLIRGSFIPPLPQRDLRDLTRQRTNLVRERATIVNRLQKVLEWANLKLASVATSLMSLSARAMLEAMVDGQTDPHLLAELARGRMRAKRPALEQALLGRVRDHHRFLIARHLIHIDFLDEQIGDFDEHILVHISVQSSTTGGSASNEILPETAPPQTADPTPPTWEEAIALWDEIPGIGRRVAEQLVAEIGTDLSRFPSAAHLASWARVAPGNNQSAGKQYSGATGHGNPWLRGALIQAAHAAVKVKDSYLGAFYKRLAGRRGVKKAIVAVAHKLLTIAYTLIRKREHYRDPGATYWDERRKDQLVQRMRTRIERLGYTIHVEPRAAAA